MKQAIFTVVNRRWVNELNIFVESWYKDKPSDVDYVLVHDGSITLDLLNYQPDVVLTLPQEQINRLKQTDLHRFLKDGWQINCGRIFIMDMLKDKYDKLLYFDTDTLVVNLQALLNYNPKKTIAAVEAEFTRQSIDIIDREIGLGLAKKIRILEQRRLNPNGYVNSGVMIINTKNLRNLSFNISEVFIRTFTNLVYIDQDFINLLFSEDIEYLDRSFNFIPLPTLRNSDGEVVKYGPKSQEYIDKYLDDLKVIHYISGWRPWLPSDTVKHETLDVTPIMQIYAEVIKRTPNIDKRFFKSFEENYKSYAKV